MPAAIVPLLRSQGPAHARSDIRSRSRDSESPRVRRHASSEARRGLGPIAPGPITPGPITIGLLLALALVASIALHLFLGSASARAHPEQTWSALRAAFGLESDASTTARALLALRFWRVLTGAGVGAALAY